MFVFVLAMYFYDVSKYFWTISSNIQDSFPRTFIKFFKLRALHLFIWSAAPFQDLLDSFDIYESQGDFQEQEYHEEQQQQQQQQQQSQEFDLFNEYLCL